MRINRRIRALYMLTPNLHQIDSPRLGAPLNGIDEDGRLITLQQRKSEVVTANAKVDYTDLVGEWAIHQAVHNFLAKRIVAVKNVPNSGDQNSALTHALLSIGSTSSEAKKKRWPGWRSMPMSFPGSSS